MALLLLRVAELVLAAALFFQSLRGMIGMLRPDSKIGNGKAWPTPIARLGAGLLLIALASAGRHRAYPFAILAAG